MARYKRNAGLFEAFATLPWQASAVAGFAVFGGMYWALPAYLSGRPYLAGLATLSRSFAWLPAVLFTLTALFSYLRMRPRATSPSSSLVEHDWKDFANEPLLDETTTQTGAEWILTAGGMTRNTHAGRPFGTWSLDALHVLEWKRFEQVCAKYYELAGFQSHTVRAGADGGIDIKLFKIDLSKPIAIVQCKSWNSADVGVKEIRKLLDVMASEKIARGIFITTGSYTRDALAFGAANPMQLLDGETFLKKICELPQEQQDALLKFAFEGDYSTPTCASCGIKMAKRDSTHGPFWGCFNYPRCKSKFNIRQ